MFGFQLRILGYGSIKIIAQYTIKCSKLNLSYLLDFVGPSQLSFEPPSSNAASVDEA